MSYGLAVLGHFSANLLAQQIDRHFLSVQLELPIRPAIAGGGALQMRTDLMN